MTLRVVLEKLASDRENLRGEARSDSDVDILVQFDRPVGLFDLARLKSHLEDLIGTRVDLVTLGGLRAAVRDRVFREAVRAA